MQMKILSATCIVIATFLIGCEDPDVIPPTISITNPADGVTLTRAVTIKVDASDDEAVDIVEFSVDGVQIGAASTAPLISNGISLFGLTAKRTTSTRKRQTPREMWELPILYQLLSPN